MEHVIKNIGYLPLFTANQIKMALRNARDQLQNVDMNIGAQEQFLSLQLQQRAGVQIVVEKGVSDLLRFTELPESLQFHDVPWLHECAEVYFEDPELPTVVYTLMSENQKLEKLGLSSNDLIFQPEDNNPDEKLLTVHIEDTGGVRSLITNEETFRPNVLNTDSIAYHIREILDPQSKRKRRDALSQLQSMTQLIIAVMFYAVSKRDTVQKNVSRKQLHKGGKAGVKARPKRPISRVILLPGLQHAEREWAKGASVAQKESRPGEKQLRPRIGFFRHYKSPRFTKMRGKTEFIAPTWAWVTASKKVDTKYRVK